MCTYFFSLKFYLCMNELCTLYMNLECKHGALIQYNWVWLEWITTYLQKTSWSREYFSSFSFPIFSILLSSVHKNIISHKSALSFTRGFLSRSYHGSNCICLGFVDNNSWFRNLIGNCMLCITTYVQSWNVIFENENL